jgi:tRNA pseudouridine13 synthase
MKLKQRPQDFRVTELLDFEESRDGEFFVHRLRKERMDTLEALDRIARAAGVKRPSLAYAGLKDRQAVTEQYISILGKRIDHEEEGLSCKFVGRSNEAISSKMSRGNRFRIIVRDLSRFDATRLRRNKASVTQHGLPNYFDDQRFGCLEHGQGLVALSLAKGRPDEALRRLIARPPQGRAAESGTPSSRGSSTSTGETGSPAPRSRAGRCTRGSSISSTKTATSPQRSTSCRCASS